MNAMPHLVEVSLLLLLMFLIGSVIGHVVRSRIPQRSSTRTAPAPLPRTSVPGAEREAPAAAKPSASQEDAKDDLKTIKGIGPKIERGLNDIGVYRFEQIAAWDQAAIADIDDQLSLRGRIEREDWAGQAAALATAGADGRNGRDSR